MNVNIEKTHFFDKIKYAINNHSRSRKMALLFQNQLYLQYIFCLTYYINMDFGLQKTVRMYYSGKNIVSYPKCEISIGFTPHIYHTFNLTRGTVASCRS